MLNKTWRFKNTIGELTLQLAFFPEGPWFNASYTDRRREVCCQVQSIEVTFLKFMFGIEGYINLTK